MAAWRRSRSPFTCSLVFSSEAWASAVSDWLLACSASEAIERNASRRVCSAWERIVWRSSEAWSRTSSAAMRAAACWRTSTQVTQRTGGKREDEPDRITCVTSRVRSYG